VAAYCIEFGTEFIPPHAEMLNIVPDVGAALTELRLAQCSDLYIRDNAADSGVVPSAGPFWDSPHIWVRNAEDGLAVHQDTDRGHDNFLYARVRNRGLAEARHVRVRFLIASFAATEFRYPLDFIPRNPGGGGAIAGPGTYLVGDAAIPAVAPGAVQTVHVRWPAALIPPAADWHPCLLIEISPEDGPPTTGVHVWQHNNLGQKNITIVGVAAGDVVVLPFRVGSKFAVRKKADLSVEKVGVPRGVELHLDPCDAAVLKA